VFFAAAGAKIDVNALVGFWPAALAIVVVRLSMIFAGTWAGARIGGLEAPARNWLWTSLIPQAGVTVALITSLDQTFGNYRWSLALSSLLLAVVAIHELIGPLLMRVGLSRCGEIPDNVPPA
jgi:Kef-type K+ transport system membrane component KefB